MGKYTHFRPFSLVGSSSFDCFKEYPLSCNFHPPILGLLSVNTLTSPKSSPNLAFLMPRFLFSLSKNLWKVKVSQSSLTLCDPIDYIVHGILQARILEWVAVPVSRGSSQPRDQIQVCCIAGGFFTRWATRESVNCSPRRWDAHAHSTSLMTLFEKWP